MPARSDKPPSMRAFGVVILCGFGLLSTLSYLGAVRSGAHWRLYLSVALAVVGLSVFLWAMIVPRTLPPVYRAWMSFGQTIGAIMSTGLLGVTYIAVVAPVGRLMRLTGNDPLERSIRGSATTYWKARAWKSDPDSYRHMS